VTRTVLALVLALHLVAAPGADDQARILRLSEKLRCLVCQNQSLADSNAELATDLRRELREQVQAGRSDEQILDFMVQRYGDFVLYQPPFKASTVFLWVGPFALLAFALVVLLRMQRRRGSLPEDAEPGEDDRKLIERTLGTPGGNGKQP
jgi:cytochrome c-type biogenesis protein CcmH